LIDVEEIDAIGVYLLVLEDVIEEAGTTLKRI
jgi:hypothetical protein